MILIVDDKQENLFSLKALLELNNYQVDTASSGEEALRKVLKNEYAVIILDVQMPGMDGYEVAEHVSSIKQTRDTPIIFLSAVNINKRFITKGYQSGGVDYLVKPIDNDLLLLKVKTFERFYYQQRDYKMIQEVLRREIDIRKQAQKDIEKTNLQLEEKVLERTHDLMQSNKDLESRNVELTQYAYLASHDLQEPLRKIITFGEIIEEKHLKDTPEAKVAMQKVIESAGRMRELINDLLSYSNLTQEKVFVKTDLNEVLKEVLADLEVTIKEKNAQIQINDLPEIDAVTLEMRQVFQNLLSNAIKFTKAGTQPVINITCAHVASPHPDAMESDNGNFVRISLKDNGIGINPKYIDKIFVIFQRLNVKSEFVGTGIGLAIVKKIIDKHNGSITVRSKEGEGAEFIILLPVKQNIKAKNQTA